MDPTTSKRLKKLRELYSESIRKFGGYVRIERSNRDYQVVFQVGTRKFEISTPVDDRELAEYSRILFCDALNVTSVNENGGLTTFHRPEDLVRIEDVGWPFPTGPQETKPD